MVAGLGRLRAAGLYRDALAYHDLGTLRIVAAWEHESRPETEAAVSLDPTGTPAPWPDIRKLLPAGCALGVDVTTGQGEPDPIYPETRVRPEIWRTWLPDVFLNPHGYPTHEWVQLCSEYAAWVRNRVVETRDYWSMRGWWMPGFAYLDDPRYPRHKAEQFKLRSMITAAINAAPEVVALNRRAYDRYTRYTFGMKPPMAARRA